MSVIERFKKAKGIAPGTLFTAKVGEIEFKIPRISFFELQAADNRARKNLKDQGFVLEDVNGIVWNWERMAETAPVLFKHVKSWKLPDEDEKQVSATKADFDLFVSEMSYEERVELGLSYYMALHADSEDQKKIFEFLLLILLNSSKPNLSTSSDNQSSNVDSAPSTLNRKCGTSPDVGNEVAPIPN